ncbi:hypothetical protein NX059_003505 [Plenodomus lindquistii]|nr:hypothetical protein NX059_003505 [Plenodomus lindquistii]
MAKDYEKQARKATRKPQGVSKARQLSPLHIRGRILRVEVGPERQGFSVHEDLLCSRSPYLKQAFQHVRKSLEGDCAICCEDLDSDTSYVTWCKTCGNNIHQDCLQQWVKTSNKCPFCRTTWKKSPFFHQSELHELDADGFEVYANWLYTARIPSYRLSKGENTTDCTRLIKAHLLGEKLQDKGFQLAVRKHIVQESLDNVQGISLASITYGYSAMKGPSTFKQFLVDLYAATGDITWLDHQKPPVLRNLYNDLMNSLLDIAEQEDGEDAVNLADAARNNVWSLTDVDRNNVWWYLANAGHLKR